MSKETCRWIYRPGINGSHWAHPGCARSGAFNYLSRISSGKQVVGCADFYNGKECPQCRKPIQMDYSLIEENCMIGHPNAYSPEEIRKGLEKYDNTNS